MTNTTRGKWQWPPTSTFFCGHLNYSKSMFLCLLNSLVRRCFRKKPHTRPSSPTNTPHMNVIAMGTNKDSLLLLGQVTVGWAETPHTRSSVISLLLDLLNSCWVRYAFYKVMIQKYTEGGHYQQLLMKIIVVFVSCEWDAGGTRMRCVWAHRVNAQVHLCIGSFSLLHCFCVPQTFDPHWPLSDKHSINKS